MLAANGLSESARFYTRPSGPCPNCLHHENPRDLRRVALVEVCPFDVVAGLITSGASEGLIRTSLRAHGYRGLREIAIIKAAQGLIASEEIEAAV